jgi:hypothetical protein
VLYVKTVSSAGSGDSLHEVASVIAAIVVIVIAYLAMVTAPLEIY